jgi:alkaline phosphatase
MDIVGIQKPHAHDNLITDSAASATAFACGVKTYNGAIGVNKDTMPVGSILEEAEMKGYATGLIATSSITHATPASFIAHNRSRRNYQEIAADFVNTDIDLFIGGGLSYFGQRTIDERNLIHELEEKGYFVADTTIVEIQDIDPGIKQNVAYFTAAREPAKLREGRNYLVDASVFALDFLSRRSDEGFFLVIEGSQIDWGGHANDLDYVLTEWKEFDEALGTILTWAERDGNTLILVTADHETGGLAIQPGSEMGAIEAAFTTKSHTGALIPVYAYGPRASIFSGIYDNTHIYHKIRSAFAWISKSAENLLYVE